MKNRNTLSALAIIAWSLAQPVAALDSPNSSASRPALLRSAMPVLGQSWSPEQDVVRGRCNATMVRAAMARPEGEGGYVLPMLHGPVLSDTPGVDAVDRGCLARTLELAPSYFTVRWTGSFGHYTVVPMRRLDLRGNQCRLFSASLTIDGESLPMRGTACRHGRDWYLI